APIPATVEDHARLDQLSLHGDWAVLSLAGPLPAGAMPLSLFRGAPSAGLPFESFGGGTDYGIWINEGSITAPTAYGTLEATGKPSQSLVKGVRGSPLCEPRTGAAVGMIIDIHQPGPPAARISCLASRRLVAECTQAAVV